MRPRAWGLGSTFSFLSIGLALGTIWVVERFVSGFTALPISGFVATLVYVCVLALEFSVAEHLRGGHREIAEK